MRDPSLTPTMAKRWFIGSLCLAAAVRLYLFWQYYCISSDGVRYIRAAEDFYTGNLDAGLKSLYPPGYPLLIAAIYPVIGDWEFAGQIWSLALGVALLFPLYWTFRVLFPEKVALVACFLAAISPFLALYSAHVRSEIPYLFLIAVALYLFLTGMQRLSKARFFWGGLVVGYAFLVRPEALGFLLLVPGVLLLRWLQTREIGFLWSMQSIALLCVGVLLFALPYIVYLSIDTGRFGAVSRKAGLTLAINLSESGLLDGANEAQNVDFSSFVFTDYILAHPLLYAKKVVTDMLPAVWVFFEALHFPFVPFLLLGLCLGWRERFWQGPDLLLLGVVLFYVFGFALIYVKRRYALQAVPFALAWTGAGMCFFWEKLHTSLSARNAARIALFVALMFLGTTLPKTLKAVSREKSYVREAGWYLKERNQAGNLRVAVFDERVTFYAETATIGLSGVGTSDLANYLRAQKANYLAAEAKAFERAFPTVSQEPEKFGLVVERIFTGTRRDRMLLFKVV